MEAGWDDQGRWRQLGRSRRNLILAAIVCAVLACDAIAVGLADGHRVAPAHRQKSTAGIPRVTVANADAGTVRWDQPLEVNAQHGTIISVAASDITGAPVKGQVDQAGTSWHSTATLVPLTRYTINVDIADAHHATTRSTLAVKTNDASQHLIPTITPGDNNTVGIGMPVVVTFNADVPTAARPLVQSRLSVSATPAVEGRWRWLNGHEVHWRPQSYWQAHTAVTATADIGGLNVGGGIWGDASPVSRFTIGDAHVATADVANHTFSVTSNGAMIKVIAMSAGRDIYPTKNGAHIVLEKEPSIIMDSQTVGIPRSSPDGYYEKVLWDVRISDGGAFVHAAPWSANDQGHRNVSHGCVNISTADAQWFYNFAVRGDVVNVVNSPSPAVLSDPGMADWNIPWSAWDTTS